MAREAASPQHTASSRTRVFVIRKPAGRIVTGEMISGDIYVIRPVGDDESTKQLKAYVDQLCKDKGYWNPDQGKWIVRHGYVNRVLETLTQAEHA
ncbi:hypothetical protein [Burkholderia cepacia]|uniref:hypothetical protein n=1 Tax=Burkholderia cepacia TaxID=292 RepID=UPI002AB64D42|nr:hypothetical protein [Burkholderia cepacia]